MGDDGLFDAMQAIDKLLSVMTLLVASIFGLQAVGLDGVFL